MAMSDLIEQMCGEMTMADCDRCQKQVEPLLLDSVPVFSKWLTCFGNQSGFPVAV
jgi:hypothetical protein